MWDFAAKFVHSCTKRKRETLTSVGGLVCICEGVVWVERTGEDSQVRRTEASYLRLLDRRTLDATGSVLTMVSVARVPVTAPNFLYTSCT